MQTVQQKNRARARKNKRLAQELKISRKELKKLKSMPELFRERIRTVRMPSLISWLSFNIPQVFAKKKHQSLYPEDKPQPI